MRRRLKDRLRVKDRKRKPAEMRKVICPCFTLSQSKPDRYNLRALSNQQPANVQSGIELPDGRTKGQMENRPLERYTRSWRSMDASENKHRIEAINSKIFRKTYGASKAALSIAASGRFWTDNEISVIYRIKELKT